MQIYISIFIFLYLLTLSTSHPLKSRRLSGNNQASDVIDPKILIRQKIDKNAIKKFIKTQPKVIENRFGEEDVDDSADDFKPVLKISSQLAKNLVTSQNNSEEFFVDKSVELRYQNGQFYQGDLMLLPDQGKFYFNSSDSEEEEEEEGGLPSRTGVIGKKYRWRFFNGYPTIFYEFWENSEYS